MSGVQRVGSYANVSEDLSLDPIVETEGTSTGHLNHLPLNMEEPNNQNPPQETVPIIPPHMPNQRDLSLEATRTSINNNRHEPLRTPDKMACSESAAQGVRKRSLPASPVPSFDAVESNCKRRQVAKCLVFGSPPSVVTDKASGACGAARCLFGPPSEEENKIFVKAVETKLTQQYEAMMSRFVIVD